MNKSVYSTVKERNAHIMERVQKHYDHIKSLGFNVVGVFLQGSQNYRLDIYNDEYMSDVDTKAIILPTLDDLICGNSMVSTKYDFEGEQIDVKDIRIMVDMWKKQNPAYLEILFTDFKILNPKFEAFINEILNMNEKIAMLNIPQLLKCISGMSKEKLIALEHPYPSLISKIEKFGYDPKQLHHIIRLYWFMNNLFIDKMTFKDSLQCRDDLLQSYLIDVKQGALDLGCARQQAIQWDNNTYELKNKLIYGEFKDYQFKNDIYLELLDIVNKMVKYNIIEQVKESL